MMDSVIPRRLRTTQLPDAPRPFDIAEVQSNIEDALAKPRLVEAADVGKLTSDAVLASYESGAKALEELRDQLKALMSSHDDMVREADTALKDIEETIATCREQGKLFAARIASSSDMIKEVRRACDDLRAKIINPTS